SIHRSAYPFLLPFDLASPMGWGYENLWSHKLSCRGLKMGIVDAEPVDHSLRQPTAYYRWEDADMGRRRLLEANPHRPLEDCFRVLAVNTNGGRLPAATKAVLHAAPRISVVIPTYNRVGLLGAALTSLTQQSLSPEE